MKTILFIIVLFLSINCSAQILDSIPIQVRAEYQFLDNKKLKNHKRLSDYEPIIIEYKNTLYYYRYQKLELYFLNTNLREFVNITKISVFRYAKISE